MKHIISCIAVILLAAHAVQADIPRISGSVIGGEDTFIYEPTMDDFAQVSGENWGLLDPFEVEGMGITISNIVFNTDPLIYNNILVANTSGGTQTYQFDITLPTTLTAPNQIRGSIDTSVIGPSALLSAPTDGSVYAALIDGVVVETLQDYSFTLGTGQDATSQSDNFPWKSSTVAIATDMGIRLTFTLSNGATAAIISDFEVVPEPSSMLLIGIASSAIIFVRRKFIV
ncbi:MAG: hypothetical protein DRP64_12875 [Verrucomicrobia bacterium]|nr:MAG: hypothetical protein DRP64_12875 [Verrucomicrobiota bacterium]